MLESIFIFLNNIISDNWYFALIASFLWGILSVILSPCHLGSIPLIVAFINGQGKISFRKAFLISTVFSIGILVSITVIGIITGITGKILGNIGSLGIIFTSVIFVIIGLYFLGIIQLPDMLNIKQPELKHKGLLSGFLLGLIFGFALGPCTFAFMAPVLSIVFNSASTHLLFSILLILFFAVGHSLVFIFFGTFSEFVQLFLNWDEKAKGTILFKKMVGVIMILVAIYLIFSQSHNFFFFK